MRAETQSFPRVVGALRSASFLISVIVQEAIYFSFGQSLIELDKDSLALDWSLLRTDDLSIWEEIGKVEIAVPKQELPYFFRFEFNQ